MKANEQHGTFTGPAEVRLVRTLPGPIERVWEYLTDDEKRARWFAGATIDSRKGGKIDFGRLSMWERRNAVLPAACR